MVELAMAAHPPGMVELAKAAHPPGVVEQAKAAHAPKQTLAKRQHEGLKQTRKCEQASQSIQMIHDRTKARTKESIDKYKVLNEQTIEKILKAIDQSESKDEHQQSLNHTQNQWKANGW